MRHIVALLTALLSVTSASAQQGIVAAPPGGSHIPDKVLQHPDISGVTLRWTWANVEASQGQYDFSYFETQLARIPPTKWVLLRVVSGGVNTPGWAFAGVRTFSFVNTDQYQPTAGETLTIPIFWSATFLARKKALIAEMGSRFANHPAVRVVSSSCANAVTDDWRVPNTSDDIENWKAVGYTSSKLINGCKAIITTTMNAFPNQKVLMAVGRNGKLDPDPDYVARTVVDWALNTYPGRFLVQKNSLSATTPDPSKTTKLGAWQILHDRRPNVAGQMLWFVTGDSACRMNGQVTPCDPLETLARAIEIGKRYGMQYQEVYQKDLLNPALDAAWP